MPHARPVEALAQYGLVASVCDVVPNASPEVGAICSTCKPATTRLRHVKS